uniref:Uncharacterized protein n=1 Tax=Anguilla anguilla TaxID=7936 RepID=A0A0E9UQF5_ANGAN
MCVLYRIFTPVQ